MERMKKIIFVLIVGGLLAGGYYYYNHRKNKPLPQQGPMPVMTAKAEKRSITRYL
jgi:hypothetical protein